MPPDPSHPTPAPPGEDASQSDAHRLPLRTKAAFGVGGIAEGALSIAFSTFAMLFYRNQLDLSGTLAGIALTIALVFDAISDPLVGSVSDRVRTRLGRRHPFLFIAPIPLGACFTAIFMPPEGLGTTGLFLWLTGFSILMRTFLTFYQVPHLALGAELSPNYLERTRVMSHNAIYQLVGGASTFFLGWTWFGSVEGGVASRSAFGVMAAGVAIASALAILASAFFTRDRISTLYVPPVDHHGFSMASLAGEIADCLRNRNYVMLLLGLVCLGAMAGLRENLTSFMNLFFWELPEDRIRWMATASPPSFILAFIVTTRLHARIDKRETMRGAIVIVMLAGFLPVLFRFVGLFPRTARPPSSRCCSRASSASTRAWPSSPSPSCRRSPMSRTSTSSGRGAGRRASSTPPALSSGRSRQRSDRCSRGSGSISSDSRPTPCPARWRPR